MVTYLEVAEPQAFWYFDLETDSLKPTVIHCAVFKNKMTHEKVNFKNNDTTGIREFINGHTGATWCAFNGISFDVPCLARICGVHIPLDQVVDPLVLSYLYNPALEGGHSLESYGIRLGYPKGSFNDWSMYSEEMLVYCERDVYLLEKVHEALLKKMNKLNYSEDSVRLEHNIRAIIDRQEQNGFWFDTVRARDLYRQLRLRESGLAEGIHRLFPPELEELGTYKYKRKKDGSDSALYQTHEQTADKLVHNIDGTYTTFKYTPFNIGSPKQRLDRLLKLGYNPTSRTKKGNPKVDEESLVQFAETCREPAITEMAEWLVTNGRANMIKTWLDALNQEDNRIHGRILTCGAASRRMIQFDPNTANIPSPKNGAKYGKEVRALWGVDRSKDRVLVGYDAAGLEARGLAHFINRPETTKLLTEGKVHLNNQVALQNALQFEVKEGGGGAKTLFYAYIYGAYPKRLGATVGRSEEVGTIIAKTLGKAVPGLQEAMDRAKQEWRRNGGRLQCIDGGWVLCPNESAALNYKVQPLGAVLMKQTAIFLAEEIERNRLDALLVGSIHDEGQLDCLRDHGEMVGKLAVEQISKAGKFYRLNVEMTGEYKIGYNWSETH